MDWSTVAPDKASPAPLYHQLAEAIRERVRAGALPPGSRLPPERELAERVGISRMTARQALGELTRSGTIVVRHGVGAFVAEPKLTYDALNLLGFSEETMRHGGAVATRVLEQAVVAPSPTVAAALGVPPGEPTVKIARLRSAAGVPVLLETSYLPRALCPGLEGEDLAHASLYALLESRYGRRPQVARQSLEATVANAYERDLFGVPVGAPMLLLEGVVSVEDDRAIELFKAVYRADRVKLALESRRPTARAEPGPPQLSVVLT